MSFSQMSIQGAWISEPKVWADERGSFHEVLKVSDLELQLDRHFLVRQVNQSSSSKGVLRGIHWTDSEEGQAKYLSCTSGALWDFVVDLRPNSSTFGAWDAVLLSANNRKSIFISEGLGHGFLALEDNTTATYLCSSEFNPGSDKVLNPFSSQLGIDFSSIAEKYKITKFILSEKDASSKDFSKAKLFH